MLKWYFGLNKILKLTSPVHFCDVATRGFEVTRVARVDGEMALLLQTRGPASAPPHLARRPPLACAAFGAQPAPVHVSCGVFRPGGGTEKPWQVIWPTRPELFTVCLIVNSRGLLNWGDGTISALKRPERRKLFIALFYDNYIISPSVICTKSSCSPPDLIHHL